MKFYIFRHNMFGVGVFILINDLSIITKMLNFDLQTKIVIIFLLLTM